MAIGGVERTVEQFKVLSIDGGGVKGLYAATILRLFEEEMQARNGPATRIVDQVDMICGTSTGGIIALALALRVSTADICQFYEEQAPDIFAGSQAWTARMRQLFWRGKFSDRKLKAALTAVFGKRTIGESDCLLCIPTYDFTHGTYGIFKFDHKEGQLVRHNRLLAVDVALATSAAPTFFPLAEIEAESNTQYVDGGVWANNPSLVGIVEAFKYFVGKGKEYEEVSLLSLPNLNAAAGKPPMLQRHRSFFRWAPDLCDLGLIAQSEFTHTVLSWMAQNDLAPVRYSRVPDVAISVDQAGYLGLDVATAKSMHLMKQMALHSFHEWRKNPTVEAFFASPKTYDCRGRL